MEEVHQWSAERGDMVQAITGIPYYYRQFGYEMGLELGGGRVGFEPLMPVLKEGEQEPFIIRPAEVSDIPFLMEVYAQARKRSLITTHRDGHLALRVDWQEREQCQPPRFRIIEVD
jgi:hypothetical protein